MSAEDDFEVKFDGALDNKHLLALVLEVPLIKESEASRKLQVGIDLIQEWREELRKDGLLDVLDEEVGDARLQVTREGLKRMSVLGKELASGKGNDVKIRFKAPPVKETIKFLRSRTTGFWMDLLLFMSTCFSLYLLKVFFENPNVSVMSFFFGSVILSITLVFYQQYKKSLKTTEFIGFLSWTAMSIRKYQQYLAIALIGMLMIYAVGMLILNPQNINLYIILSVVIASTGQLINLPKKTFTGVFLFYTGVVLLSMGLLIVVGMMSLTQTIFGQEIRLLDFVFGVGILIIVYLNEVEFGLGSMKKAQK
jgi:hypothetical protein